MIYGKEKAPTTGHEHLQGYVQFTKRKRFTEVIKILSGEVCHWEPARGSHEDNFNYCSKDGDYKEFGTRPEFEDAGAREKRRWEDALLAAKSGEFDKAHPQIQLSHWKGMLAINKHYRQLPDTMDAHGKDLKEHFMWLYGEPGCGKTSWAMDFGKDQGYTIIRKLKNKWWPDNVVDWSKVVAIVDDVDLTDGFLGHFIKEWCQEYPFACESKGGIDQIRPAFIIFTSNYHPFDIWTDRAMRASIERRIDIIFHGKDESYRWREVGFVVPNVTRPVPLVRCPNIQELVCSTPRPGATAPTQDLEDME